MYNSSERWKRLLADSKKEEEELRNLLEITVYGSFKPESEKERLIKLVDAIRLECFPSCDIVCWWQIKAVNEWYKQFMHVLP